MVDTFSEHKDVEIAKGHVWWGKFGLGVSKRIVVLATQQIKKEIPTYVYLATRGAIRYYARLVEIRGGGARAKYPAPVQSSVPKYYRNEKCPVWLKLTYLREVPAGHLSRLQLFLHPGVRPTLRGTRGMIYVTFDQGVQ